MANTNASRSFRFRLSLLSLFFFITTAAAIVMAWVARRDLAVAVAERDRVESELQQVGYRFGEIMDDDPHGLLVLAHPTVPREEPDSHRWEWTVKLPTGEQADLCFVTGAIPGAGLVEPHETWDLGPGIHRVSLEVFHGREHRRSDTPPKWRMVLQVNGKRLDAGKTIAELLPSIYIGNGNYKAAGQVYGTLGNTAVDQTPIELIHYSDAKGARPAPARGPLGFRLWLVHRTDNSTGGNNGP